MGRVPPISPWGALRLGGASLALWSASAGCVPQAVVDANNAVAAYHAGDYPAARRLLQPLAKDPNENFALNNCRLGSTDLAMYDVAGSQAALLQAYDVLNSYGTNDGGRTLGAVLVDQGIRIWRGEPFERAMANYYLGLTYYLQRDYNNARGAFENALFKLKDYGVAAKDDKQPDAGKFTEVDSNFVLARYLLARCYQRLGEEELATANFARVVQVRPDLAALADPARNAAANVLVVVDFGDGPRKATDEGGYVTGFVPPPAAAGPIPLPVVTVDGQWLGGNGANSPLIDLLALAQDTRWQTIDTIRTVKSALGTGLIAGGALTAAASGRNRNVGYAGLGLVAAGLLLKATSQADLRVWDTLPRATFAVAMTVPPGKHNLAVSFPAVGAAPAAWLGVDVPTTGEVTYYFRMHRASGSQRQWPPPTLTGWPEAITPPVAEPQPSPPG